MTIMRFFAIVLMLAVLTAGKTFAGQNAVTTAPQAGGPYKNETYRISFKRFHGLLDDDANMALDAALPRLREADRIVIQGRPDHATIGKPDLPSRRANSIRKYLLKNGIAEQNIVTELLPEPDEVPPGDDPANRRFYAGVVAGFIVPVQPVAAPETVEDFGIPVVALRRVINISQQSEFSGADISQLFESWYAIESPNMRVLQERAPDAAAMPLTAFRRMLNVVDKGQLSAAELSRLFESWVAIERPAQSQLPVTRTNAMDAVHKTQWKLDPSRTLRDNIDVWALEAGWNPTEWKASNYFQIASPVTLSGEFAEVLHFVAGRAGLSLCLSSADKTILVSDQALGCSD